MTETTDAAWQERARRLKEEADRDWPAAWIPENEGDEIAGAIIAVQAAVRTTYGPVPVG